MRPSFAVLLGPAFALVAPRSRPLRAAPLYAAATDVNPRTFGLALELDDGTLMTVMRQSSCGVPLVKAYSEGGGGGSWGTGQPLLASAAGAGSAFAASASLGSVQETSFVSGFQ